MIFSTCAKRIILVLATATLLSHSYCSSFSNHPSTILNHNVHKQTTKSSSSLEATTGGGGGLFGSKNSNKGFGKKKEEPSSKKEEITIASPSESSTTTKAVLEFPVESIKMAPLRFFLQIYLAGEQKDSGWIPKQSDNCKDGEEGLEAYFQDGTGMCLISFQEDKIQFIRYGERPSLQYMLQESLLIHRVLDELTKLVFEVDDDIDMEKRLIGLPSDDTIEKAREQLPARKEQ